MPVPFFGWREPIFRGAGLERGRDPGLYSGRRVPMAVMPIPGAGDMRFGRIAFALLLVGLALGVAGFDTPPKPEPKNQQYIMGYQAGRRDERAELCSRFERHAAMATGLLGEARMVLIRAFCAAHS